MQENSSSTKEQTRSLLKTPQQSLFHAAEGGTCWTQLFDDFFCTRSEGHYCLEMAERQTLLSEEVLQKNNSLYYFLDWEQLKSYDTDARNHLTKWCVSNRKRLKEVHILSGFFIVRMGVTVANMALAGKLTAHEDWENYQDCFRKSWEKNANK